MTRVIRTALILYALGLLAGATGCGKDEGKPNPELKVPDVPASGSSDGKGDMSSKNKKK